MAYKRKPKLKKFLSENFKRLWENATFREKAIAGQRRAWKRKDVRKKHAEVSKAQWADPVFRKKFSEIRSASKYKPSLETIEKLRENMRSLWRNPKFRKAMTRKGRPGHPAKLGEAGWADIINLLRENPKRFGYQTKRWDLRCLASEIKKRWKIKYSLISVRHHLLKRGCRIVRISRDEKPDVSKNRYRYTKWIGPRAGAPWSSRG